MLPDELDPIESAAEPLDPNQNPAADSENTDPIEADQPQTDPADAPESESTEPRQKRNCGRTGATSPEGKAKAARNATRHGLCSETLILPYEDRTEFENLLTAWLADYRNPADNTVLYTMVVKVVQAEWFRLRTQKEYNNFVSNYNDPPMHLWNPIHLQQHDLLMRYVTAAERRYHREYRALEHHWKSHAKPALEEALEQEAEQPEPVKPWPLILFQNNETGESVDADGNRYPAPPNYVCRPIIPGVYDPDHPAYVDPNQPRKKWKR